MMGRITQGMMNTQLLSNLNANLIRSNNYQNQMATGRKINKPSDDPVGLSYAMRYRSELTANDQYGQNVDSSKSWLDFTDSMLGQTSDVMQRVRELAVQGANGTNSKTAMDAIKLEVMQLTKQLATIGNSQFNGKYIFNGQLTDIKPYDDNITALDNAVPYTSGTANGNVDVVTASTAVSNTDNVLVLHVDGKPFAASIPPGTYNSDTLVYALQDSLDTTVGKGLTKVSINAGNGITITSNTKGMSSTVAIDDSTFAKMHMSTAGDLSDITTTQGVDGGKYVVQAKKGDSDYADINFEIATGIKLPVNITGQSVFGSSTNDDNLFRVMNELTNALDDSDYQKVSNMLGKFDSRMNKFLEVRATVGARSNRVDLSMQRISDTNANLQELQSKTEDANMAELITNMKTNENIYQASLSVGAKIISPSLVDFLK